jgi:transposase-like protein
MGERQRKQYSGDVKARAAVEAIRGARTLNEIAKDYGAHPVQITKWKKSALDALPAHFSRRKEAAEKTVEEERARLYEEIGRLKVELDWLKKKSGLWGL